jgi:spermidine synthase
VGKYVYLLFLCSGFSGLVYQVVWVRAFGNVFGNTIHSASLVIAVFMLGLGAGSYAVGAWADRRYADRPDSLLRVFGAFELAIGVLALSLSALLPRLGDLAGLISWYTVGPDGWHALSAWSHLARAGLAAALLTPITVLMGGTLTLLIRHLIRSDLHVGGLRIALLYAANTVGAAAGAFLTDFSLVPALGLRGTQLVAFAFNLVAAGGAFYIGHGVDRSPEGLRLPKSPRRAGPTPRTVAGSLQASGPTDSALPWTAAAIALSGFAAMGMEIVWFRHFSVLLGEYRAVFSLLLTVVLCGIGLGSLIGGWLCRRVERPAAIWMIVQGLFVASTLLGLMLVDARAIRDASTSPVALAGWARAWAELWFNATPIVLVAGVPSLLMGFSYPVANALIQRAESRVGRRAGALYLASTVGAVGGSLAAGFLLLPVLGMQRTTTVLAGVAAMAIGPLHMAMRHGDQTEPRSAATSAVRRRQTGSSERPQVGWAFAFSLALAAIALGAWLMLPSTHLLSRALLFPVERAYALREGLTAIVAVTDGPDGGRVLVTNGHPMSSTELFSQRYMRAMAHIPLLAIENPSRVLVLCYGVGNTAHAASLHPSVQRVDVVDLSRDILQHSTYFKEFNHDVLHDSRVAVYVNDGRAHLRMEEPGTYDLITLEPPPIVHAGVAALYSREFYASARSRLTPRGYISQWLPVFGVPNGIILSMIRAFIDVFPNAVLLSGANTNLLLIATNGARNEIDPGRLAAALAKAPSVRHDLERLDLGTLREIVGTFVAPQATLASATRDAIPITDDRPIQEYGRRSLLDFGEGGIDPALIAVDQVTAWCPSCFAGGTPSPLVEGLDTYLALTRLAYMSGSGSNPGPLAKGRTVAGSGYLGAIVPDSPEVQKLLAGPPRSAATDDVSVRYARATTLLESGRFQEAISELRLVLEATPDAVQALNNLGVALASLGRIDEAITQFERALEIQPGFEDARRNLALARQKSK